MISFRNSIFLDEICTIVASAMNLSLLEISATIDGNYENAILKKEGSDETEHSQCGI
jgi:hypothetical protein